MNHHSEPLIIADTEIKVGERKIIKLPSPRLYTNTPIDIPVHVLRGKKNGPRLFIIAAIHGDEINGIDIIRRLLKSPELDEFAGTLIIVPVANVFGLLSQSRYLPDRRDLNRCFPGTPQGSLASRIANLFVNDILKKCDGVIDLHTAAVHRRNLPQLRVYLDQPGVKELAEAFNAPIIVDACSRDGSLRQTCNELNIPALVYECGEALRFNEFGIRVGLKGILFVMEKLQMIPKIIQDLEVKEMNPMVAHSTIWVRAPMSGVMHKLKIFGNAAKKGDVLALITDPLGSKECEVKAPVDGVVIGIANLPLVNAGDALFHLGCFEYAEEVSSQVDQVYNFIDS